VVTTGLAVGRGLTTGRVEDVDVVGEALADMALQDFRGGTEAPIDPGLLPRPVRMLARLLSPSPNGEDNDSRGASAMRLLAHNWVWRQMVARPQATERCIACGFCVTHCPVNAIEIVDGRARMDPKTCIRCYCCHELCPHEAIDLVKPLLGRLVLPR
jgi:ferredoxin